jgi:solute carrier family 45 protein 1/2/4
MTAAAELPSPEFAGVVDNEGKRWVGEPRTVGPRWLHLPSLGAGQFGIAVFWSVEMSYGVHPLYLLLHLMPISGCWTAPPYLLSLGVSKARMALVFAAGPLSGLIVQPLVGILSDACTSRFGRRRPFIALGTLVCMGGMLLLGFTRNIASVFTSEGSHLVRVYTNLVYWVECLHGSNCRMIP